MALCGVVEEMRLDKPLLVQLGFLQATKSKIKLS